MTPAPFVASVSMGYGHLRPAYVIAKYMDTDVEKIDGPPWTSQLDQTYWHRTRNAYEGISRASQAPVIGSMFRMVLSSMTSIPSLYPQRDLSGTDIGTRYLDKMIGKGFCDEVVTHLKESGRPLITTFYAPAIAAAKAGVENVFCMVTDSDIHRIWAPRNPRETLLHYLAPSPRVVQRLRAYGVPPENIHLTGFPFADELLGGRELTTLRRDLAHRMFRLDPRGVFRDQLRRELGEHAPNLDDDDDRDTPVHLAFAVGGAGAQSEIAEAFLPSLKPLLEGGRLRVTLIAGTRPEVKERFAEMIHREGYEPKSGPVRILHKRKLKKYFKAFNALLQETDILWTKPSELSFFAALGIPLICAPPMGQHERYNRRWAIENGAAMKQRNPRETGDWLTELLHEGTLSSMAWSGFVRLPKTGLYEIADRVRGLSKHSG